MSQQSRLGYEHFIAYLRRWMHLLSKLLFYFSRHSVKVDSNEKMLNRCNEINGDFLFFFSWKRCWWQGIKEVHKYELLWHDKLFGSTFFSICLCCDSLWCDVYPQDNALGQAYRAGDWQSLSAHHWSSAVERGECVALFL